MTAIRLFGAKVDEFLKDGRPTIAFGLLKKNATILASLDRCRTVADIRLVGPADTVSDCGFDYVDDDDAERRLATLLASDEVDGIVRGTLDDKKTIRAYIQLTGERDTVCPALLEDPSGRQFFIGPVSNSDGWTRDSRLGEVLATAAFVKDWDIEPRIAVYSAIRHETYVATRHETSEVQRTLNQSYEDAQWIQAELKRNGYEADHTTIDFNEAVDAGYNIHVPVNGMVGNQMFRILLVCGGKILTATRIGLSRPYEDNSRSETEFDWHVRWLAALINRRKYH